MINLTVKHALKAAMLVVPFLSGTTAFALTQTFDTAPGATAGGLPVNVEVVTTTGAGTLDVKLTNLQGDPLAIIQAVSDLEFTLSSGQTSGTLASSSGLERTIAADGTFTDGATVATGWTTDGLPGLSLDVLSGTGHAGPAHLAIGEPAGSGDYDAANASIAGNGPHNPFLAGTLDFLLDVNGLTAADSITGLKISFGTGQGAESVVIDIFPPEGTVPDGGGTMLLLGGGLSALAFLRRKLS
jgi:VPDSG-CTERM motif